MSGEGPRGGLAGSGGPGGEPAGSGGPGGEPGAGLPGPAEIPGALITGATGFVGRALCGLLSARGIEFTAFGGRRTGENDEAALDVTDLAAVSEAVIQTRPSHLFHLAASREKSTSAEAVRAALAVNLTGTVNVVAAASKAGCKRVIIAGTAEEYGSIRAPFNEDDRERPATAYGLSKLAATRTALAMGEMAGLEVTVLRITVAYGPGQPSDSLLGGLCSALAQGRRFPISRGTQTRDYVWVDDVAEGLVRGAAAPEARGRVINLGRGISTPVADVAMAAAALAGHPELLGVGEATTRPGEPADYGVDMSLASDLLGWCPPTALEDGLKMMLDAL